MFNPDGLKIKSDSIVQIMKSITKKEFSKIRVVDLGCCEGYYSIALAKSGVGTVLGIEAREKNLEVARKEKMDNMIFYQDDVKNFNCDEYGFFDIVLAAGILYHLDFESACKLLESCFNAGDILILDTIVADKLPEKYHHLVPDEGYYKEERYDGVKYNEPIAGLNKQQIEDRPTSAYSNDKSFWFLEESLTRLLIRIGYKTISKVIYPKPIKVHHRDTYIVLKESR